MAEDGVLDGLRGGGRESDGVGVRCFGVMAEDGDELGFRRRMKGFMVERERKFFGFF